MKNIKQIFILILIFSFFFCDFSVLIKKIKKKFIYLNNFISKKQEKKESNLCILVLKTNVFTNWTIFLENLIFLCRNTFWKAKID